MVVQKGLSKSANKKSAASAKALPKASGAPNKSRPKLKNDAKGALTNATEAKVSAKVPLAKSTSVKPSSASGGKAASTASTVLNAVKKSLEIAKEALASAGKTPHSAKNLGKGDPRESAGAKKCVKIDVKT